MTSPPKPEHGDGVAAVDRALAIVGAVAQSAEPFTLADLSRATGFYKSTLLRLLVSLEKVALVVRRSDGRYELGPYAHQLGHSYESAYRIDEMIQPILQRLVDGGSESGSFHVFHDASSRICILRVDSHHPTLDRVRVGDLLPLDRGAAGRLITIHRNRSVAPSAENVFTISMGERDGSCAAVACSVFDANSDFCGAISLSGPKERFTPDAITRLSNMVRQAARQGTEALGGRWPV